MESREIYVTVYTREGKQEITWDERVDFDDSKLYREDDLPTVEYPNVSKHWFKYGKQHRETGPASVWSDGNTYHYLAGQYFSEEDFYKKLREVDELPISLALTHQEEWIRDRAKRRKL